MAFGGNFNSGYGPGGNMTANLQLQGLSDGPGADWESMLDKLYWMKNRPQRPGATPNNALKQGLQIQRTGPKGPDLATMMNTNDFLQRDLYSANGTRINRDWMTMPMAATMSGIKLPQETGWDVYAKLANALGGQSSAAVGAAAENNRTQMMRDDQDERNQIVRGARMYGGGGGLTGGK